MSHVENRWHKRDGKGRRIRTPRYGTGRQYRARWTDPDGRERSRSFDTEAAARAFLVEVDHAKHRGTYRDPDAGKVTLRRYAEQWLAAQGFDPVTREGVRSRLATHVYPPLGGRTLAELSARPSLVQAWVSGLPLAPSTAGRVYGHLNTIMRAAVRDRLITDNPCPGTRLPKATQRRVAPWTRDQAAAVRAALPEQLAAFVDAGTGMGLRQSELFGLAVESVDFLRRTVHVRQQVKLIGGRLHFAAPKGAKERSVPLARQTAEALAAHLAAFPARPVTLPWHEPGTRRHGKPHTAALIFTTPDGRALHRNAFNAHVWKPATRAAGLADDRVNGCHMLRHVYASTLIARGVDVRTVAAYLGHSDGGALLLKVYAHLLPDADDRARRALESALSDGAPEAAPTRQV